MPPEEDRFSFTQRERLKSSASIKMVMDERKCVSSYPLKCFYRICENSTEPVKVAVVVSKRRFKHAVDRNRVKRLVRESYRLQKHKLNTDQASLQLCWMFIGKEMPDYSMVYESVAKILDKINAAH